MYSKSELKEVTIVKRDKDKGYGFSIHKHHPVVINKVTPNGPAHKAGVRIGDQIVIVEGRQVFESPHDVVANMIKSKRQVRLVLRPAAIKATAADADEEEDDDEEEENNRNDAAAATPPSDQLSVDLPLGLERCTSAEQLSTARRPSAFELDAASAAAAAATVPAVASAAADAGVDDSFGATMGRPLFDIFRPRHSVIVLSENWTPQKKQKKKASGDLGSAIATAAAADSDEANKAAAVEAYKEVLAAAEANSDSNNSSSSSDSSSVVGPPKLADAWAEFCARLARIESELDISRSPTTGAAESASDDASGQIVGREAVLKFACWAGLPPPPESVLLEHCPPPLADEQSGNNSPQQQQQPTDTEDTEKPLISFEPEEASAAEQLSSAPSPPPPEDDSAPAGMDTVDSAAPPPPLTPTSAGISNTDDVVGPLTLEKVGGGEDDGGGCRSGSASAEDAENSLQHLQQQQVPESATIDVADDDEAAAAATAQQQAEATATETAATGEDTDDKEAAAGEEEAETTAVEKDDDAEQEDEEDDEEDPDVGTGSFMLGTTAHAPESAATESALKALLDVFGDVQKVKKSKPGLMLFLHLLLSRVQDGHFHSVLPLLFDLLADDWAANSATSKAKHAKRTVYELYSTFLHPQSPLSLTSCLRSCYEFADLPAPACHQPLEDAVQTVSRLLESGGQDEATKRQLALQLAAAQAALQPALARLAQVAGQSARARQRDGFSVGDMLLSTSLKSLEGLLRGGGVEAGDSVAAQKMLLTKWRPVMMNQVRALRESGAAPAPYAGHLAASCLATVLLHSLRLGAMDTGSTDSLLNECAGELQNQQLFNTQHQRSKSAARLSILGVGSRSEKTRIGPHTAESCCLDGVKFCSTCSELVCGPGPQGFHCVGGCSLTVHRRKDCTDKLAGIPCKKNAQLKAASIGKAKSFRGGVKRSERLSPSSPTPRNQLEQQKHQQQQQQPPKSLNGGAVAAAAAVATFPEFLTPPPERSSGGSQFYIDHAAAAAAAARRPTSMVVQLSDAADRGYGDLLISGGPASMPTAKSEQSVDQLISADELGPKSVEDQLPRTDSISSGSHPTDAQQQPQHQQLLLQPPPIGGKAVKGGNNASKAEQRSPNYHQQVSKHPDIANVPADLGQYIVQHNVNGRLQALKPYADNKEFERLKEYQIALHEIVFACMSHVRALTVLDLLFVQPWPQSCQAMRQQLGLHFVPRCIALYKHLLSCVGKPSLSEFDATGQMTGFGQRLLAWYADEQNVTNFKLLSLSFGFSRSSVAGGNKQGAKRSTGNEDDLILRLEALRRDNSELAHFFQQAEMHEAMQRLGFKGYYSSNMVFTMRMSTLLEKAAKSARKAKGSTCKYAEKDASDLDKCVEKAKQIIEYSNTTGVKLKELSRQLVLSRTFESFWERCKLDKEHVDRVRDQISHLHTCQLFITREVAMPGFENFRLRLLVFTEFLLIISESEEPKGVVKYQLLRHLGQSMSVGGQTSDADVSNPMGSLRAVSCPPIIPMPNVIHVFEGRQQKSTGVSSKAATEFRIVIDHPSTTRTESLLVVFALRRDKPRMPFFDRETDTSAIEVVDCIRRLHKHCKANAPKMDRSSSVHSIGSTVSAPGVLAAVSEDALHPASSGRNSTLAEDKEAEEAAAAVPDAKLSNVDADADAKRQQQSPPLTPAAVEDVDGGPGAASQEPPPQQQTGAAAGDEAAGTAEVEEEVLRRQIDEAARRHAELAAEQRRLVCATLRLDQDSFDYVAECAKENSRPSALDGVLVAWQQYEQLIATMPRLLKALLRQQRERQGQQQQQHDRLMSVESDDNRPCGEAAEAVAEALLEQLAEAAGATADVLRRIGGGGSGDGGGDGSQTTSEADAAVTAAVDEEAEAVASVEEQTDGIKLFPEPLASSPPELAAALSSSPLLTEPEPEPDRCDPGSDAAATAALSDAQSVSEPPPPADSSASSAPSSSSSSSSFVDEADGADPPRPSTLEASVADESDEGYSFHFSNLSERRLTSEMQTPPPPRETVSRRRSRLRLISRPASSATLARNIEPPDFAATSSRCVD